MYIFTIAAFCFLAMAPIAQAQFTLNIDGQVNPTEFAMSVGDTVTVGVYSDTTAIGTWGPTNITGYGIDNGVTIVAYDLPSYGTSRGSFDNLSIYTSAAGPTATGWDNGPGTYEYMAYMGWTQPIAPAAAGTWWELKYTAKTAGDVQITLGWLNPAFTVWTYFDTAIIHQNVPGTMTDKLWNGGVSTDWLASGNWSDGTEPKVSDRVKIGHTSRMPSVVGYDRWGTAGEVWVGYASGNDATLVIDNFAGLNINDSKGDLYIGSGCNGYVYLKDGFIWCRNCYVNWGGWGQLEINSGGLTCNTINVAGKVNLYGYAAYIDTNDLQFSGSNKAIELKDGGRLIWRGDHQAAVQNFINQGLIYCTGGTVLYDYNFSTLNATTVYATTKPVVSPISLSNQNNQTIRGKYIRNLNGNGILLNNCNNITIEDCEIGPCKDRGVDAEGGSNITIDGCKFRNCVAAVWFWQGGNNMKVLNCWILNSMKRAYTYAHGVAMCGCNGTGLEISNNRIQNQGSYASMTDNINTYQSNGTAASPLLVENNWIKNWNQTEQWGCGITTVDQGGSYNEVRFNRLVNPQYCGIQIAGGHHSYIHDNYIFGDKNWNVYGWCALAAYDYAVTGNCSSNTVIHNKVSFMYAVGNYRSCKWTEGSCGTIIGWDDNDCNYNGTPDDFLSGNIFYRCEYRPFADISDDCLVNETDLGIFSQAWLFPGTSVADIHVDGIVDLLDLAILAEEWLSCGFFPPSACP